MTRREQRKGENVLEYQKIRMFNSTHLFAYQSFLPQQLHAQRPSSISSTSLLTCFYLVMNWDRVGTMKKIDDAGASFMKQVRNQRDAGKGVGVQDRWKMAQGKDERWEQSKKRLETEQQGAPESASASTSHGRMRVPPAVAGSGHTIGKAPPPPPPARSNSSRSTGATASNQKTDYIEFSKFTEHDKQAFFQVLDRFFDDKLSLSTATSSNTADPPPNYTLADQSQAPEPPSRAQLSGAAPPIAPRSESASTSASTSTCTDFPLLTASSSSPSDPCSALSAATFFVYPSSFPEWSSQWYTSTVDRHPPHLRNRKDLLWKCSTSYIGSSHSMTGCLFFQDLSTLIYKIEWDSNRSQEYAIQVQYKDVPVALASEILEEASCALYGEIIASFAEGKEQDGRAVGDGECWTLAKEAIDSVDQYDVPRIMKTNGRTHGHLIYHGTGAKIKQNQMGRWRGGDRNRKNWGGVRRGDIVEWWRSTCSEVGARKGSWCTLGDPEHTAVIISDSPVPDRLEDDLNPEIQPEVKPYELESITVIEQSAGQVPTRKTYDLSTFTEGKMWIYRPIGLDVYLGGEATPEFPSSLAGMERLA